MTVQEVAYLLRFFRVVSPIPPLMYATFAVLTATAAAAVISDPGKASGALAPTLLLQLFAASSGFALPARRGHYDLLLTRGANRLLVAFAHWATSIAPGVASWLVIAVVEHLVSAGTPAALLASGTWAAVMLVSTLPWALTVSLPRFSGGIGWLLVLVTVTTTFSTGVAEEWIVTSPRVHELVWAAWAFLVYPVAAVGQPLTPIQMMAVAPALVLSLGAMVTACRWVAQAEFPLEAAQ